MDSFIACHECDVIHRIKPLSAKGAAHCIRCRAVLYKHKPNSLDRTLAFAFAGLILFILANSFPFMGLKIGAQIRQTTLITGIYELYVQDMRVIAILVLIGNLLLVVWTATRLTEAREYQQQFNDLRQQERNT